MGWQSSFILRLISSVARVSVFTLGWALWAMRVPELKDHKQLLVCNSFWQKYL